MRISTRGVYALEAMLALGSLQTDERVSIRQISDGTGLSDSYLEQIFALLKKAGLLSSTRGNRGGYALGRAAQTITVGDIIRAAEGPLSPVVCAGDDDQPACDRYGICLSRTVWGKMETEINDFVDQIPLSDLIADFHETNPGSDMEIYI